LECDMVPVEDYNVPSADREAHQCPPLTHSGHLKKRFPCPLLGVKRTWAIALQMSAYDPKRTSAVNCIDG
jgi:hypothetical protein